LGQGLSVGIGMALAAKLKSKDYYTFVILGDGETQEGQIWEAAMFASHYKLNNITAILDYNNVQLMGAVSDVMEISPVADKWNSFGWKVKEINGHDFKQIIEGINWAKEYAKGPTILIANTIKGKGVSFMQNACEWHGGLPTEDEYNRAIKELKLKKP
jgi:transketolase